MRAQLPFTQLTNLARMALKLLSYYPGEIPKALNAERRTQTRQHKQMKPARWQIVKGPLEKQKATENVRRTFGSSKKKKKKKKRKTNRFHSGKSALCPACPSYLPPFTRYLSPVAALLFRFYSLTIFRL